MYLPSEDEHPMLLIMLCLGIMPTIVANDGRDEVGARGGRDEGVWYRPYWGSAAYIIMFVTSNICWVSSGTVRTRCC